MRLYSFAGDGSKFTQGQGWRALGLAIGQHRRRQGMLAILLQGSGHGDKAPGVHPGRGAAVRDLGLALREGAGLIQGHNVHAVGGFQGLGGFDQDALFRPFPGAYHDGHRRGQAQGAGAGYHQDRDAGADGEFRPGPGQQPGYGRHQGDGHDAGHEHAGHLIRQLGDGGLAARRLLHQADHGGQGSILPHLLRPEAQAAAAVDAAGPHLVPGLLVGGHAFPGKGALVHGTAARRHRAVHRDPAPGLHHQDVPGLHLLHRHLYFRPVLVKQGGVRRQIHELLNAFSSFALAFALQIFAHRHQGQDHAGGFKIQVAMVLGHHIHIPMAQAIAHHIDGKHPVQERRPGADGHQGVHIGGPMKQGGNAAAIIAPV